MGKKKVGKAEVVQAARPDDSGAATCTTRLTAEQREKIDAAAAEIGWSPAKFIREAAVLRAADVLNATGPNRSKLREFARALLEQVFNPSIERVWQDEQTEEEDVERESLYESRHRDEGTEEAKCQYRHEHHQHVIDTRPVRRLTDSALGQLQTVFEFCPVEFAKMLLEEWSRAGIIDPGFQPKVSAAELLKGGDE